MQSNYLTFKPLAKARKHKPRQMMFCGKPVYQCKYCRNTDLEYDSEGRCLCCGGSGVEHTRFVRKNMDDFERAYRGFYWYLA